MTTKSDNLASVQTAALVDAERKFKRACAQVNLLNAQLEEMQTRYQRAKDDGFRSFRYNLRLKLACNEGVRNMYYEYAYAQAEIVVELRRQLYGEEVDISMCSSKPSNAQLEEMQGRYQRAKDDGFRSFRYNLRLKLACNEGVRNMYYEYAYAQAEIVVELRRQLYGEEVDISDYLASVQTAALVDAERKFERACAQVNLLNAQLEEMQARYQRAKDEGLRSFRYNLRLKLACNEGVRNMYYEYAYAQAEIVVELRRQLYGEEVDIVSGNDDLALDD
ncbi:hypothetical protein MAR_007173 [Mya arenaria]|uniref:Uncharacterized protein n=1 Tax=Mya arenaria TaxID=6604 RepID=A0ABY7DAL8_MYAAR|nr:hypothetical protein MAR_007173 [Mya arenaria]